MIAALESERELLGGVLLGNLDWLEIASAVASDEWADPGHRQIVQILDRLAAHGSQWDGVSVVQEAQGGARELAGDLMASARLLSKGVDWHVTAIRNAARRRKLIAECQRIALLATNNKDADSVLSDAQAAMLSLLDNQTRSGPVSVTDTAKDWYDELERRLEMHGDVLGLPTGFPKLDELTGGLEPGELVIIAGRPGHGKTTLAMNVAEHALLREEKSVLVFSLEISRQELVTRMAASMSRVNLRKFRTPRQLDEADWPRVTQAMSAVHGKPLWIDDTGALHINQIRARARAHAQRKGLQLIVVDYLGLARGDSPKLYEAVTQISGQLKALAKELHVPVIAVAQLNRDVERRKNGRPMMSDLRDSGAVEQDADKILFVWRPEVSDPDNVALAGAAEVVLAKNRNGVTGTVDMTFRGEFNRFEQAEVV
jgi:replicative DNA helicase